MKKILKKLFVDGISHENSLPAKILGVGFSLGVGFILTFLFLNMERDPFEEPSHIWLAYIGNTISLSVLFYVFIQLFHAFRFILRSDFRTTLKPNRKHDGFMTSLLEGMTRDVDWEKVEARLERNILKSGLKVFKNYEYLRDADIPVDARKAIHAYLCAISRASGNAEPKYPLDAPPPRLESMSSKMSEHTSTLIDYHRLTFRERMTTS